MADVNPNTIQTLIKATGFNKGQEVDLWYTIWYAFRSVCAKLDADGGVTDTDYLALCFTAIMTGVIHNSGGGVTGYYTNAADSFSIYPGRIDAVSRHKLLYQFTDAFETLCEKLDADGTVNDTDYEANCYTAKFLHIIKDVKGVTDLGNGTVYYFTPGHSDREQLVEWLYNALDGLETLVQQLDADSGVTDTDYESAVFDVITVISVQNAAGSVIAG